MKHNKEEVIDKGIELMRQSGYHAVGVREIVKACGMPKGSFYNFFESKEEFTGLAIEKYHKMGIEKITHDLSGEGSPLEKIRRHFEGLTEYYEEKKCHEGCLFINLSSEIGLSHKNLAHKIEAYYQDWISHLAAEIRKGQEIGEIIPTMAPEAIANHLYNSFNGAVTRMKIQGSHQVMREFLDLHFTLIQI